MCFDEAATNSSKSYFYEVNLECHESLHRDYNSFPLGAVKCSVAKSWLSEYPKRELQDYKITAKDSVPKLLCTLQDDKDNYLCH